MSWLSTPPTFDVDKNAGNVIWIELQRILAPIMVSKWTVLRSSGRTGFVLNDQGWFAIRSNGKNVPGFVIPLRSDAAVHIEPRFQRTIAVSGGPVWLAAEIETRVLSADDTWAAIESCAEWAREEIYGSDANVLLSLRTALLRQPWVTDLRFLGFPSGSVLIPTDLDWHRACIQVMAAPGTGVPMPKDLPPPRMMASLPFLPPLVFALNLPRSPGGLMVLHDEIRARLMIEAWMVGPELTQLERVKAAPLLDHLAQKYGLHRLRDAEREFWLLRGTTDKAQRTSRQLDVFASARGESDKSR
jgi:hypothetical protein